MARDDTRLHRLEAMVAGLLAWQHDAEARVAAMEHTVGVVLENYRSHLERDHEHKHVEWLEADLQAGGPEPAAEHETRVLMAKGSERGLSRAPQGDRAAQNEAPIAAPTSHATQQRDSRPAPAQAAQPAPQQPRSCATCACEPGSIECEGCTPGLPLGWQPRGGGG